MAEFVVLQAGGNGIFAAQNPRAGHDMGGHAVRRGQIVRLWRRPREIGGNVLANFFEIRLTNASMRVAMP